MHFITLVLFVIDQTVSPSNIDHWVCLPTDFCTVGLKTVFFLEFTIQTTSGMSLTADRAAPRPGIRPWENTKTEWVIWEDLGSRQEEEVRTHKLNSTHGIMVTGNRLGIERQGGIMGFFQQVLGSSWCWTPDSMRADNWNPGIAYPSQMRLSSNSMPQPVWCTYFYQYLLCSSSSCICL